MNQEYYDMPEDYYDPYEAESQDIYGDEGDDYDDLYDAEFAPEYYDPYEAAEARRVPRRSRVSRRPARSLAPSSLPGRFPRRRYFRQPPPGGRSSKASARSVDRAFQRTQAVIEREKAKNRRQGIRTSRRLKDQEKLAKGTQTAFALSQAVDAWKAQNPPFLQNDVVKAALPLAPLVFLRPGRPQDAKELAQDPRVWAGLLTVGAALFNQFGGKAQAPSALRVTPGGQVKLNQKSTLTLTAVALAANGTVLAGQPNITWTSSDDKVVKVVNPATGELKVTGSTEGQTAVITATIDGTSIRDTIILEVGK